MEPYKFLEHTADVKFQAFGKDLNEAFSNAALALTDVVVDIKQVKEEVKKEISVEAEDKKSLLYDFLEKLIYLLDVDHFLASKVSVLIDGNKLKATLEGSDKLDSVTFKTHVKAVTYSEMLVEDNMVQVVLDL